MTHRHYVFRSHLSRLHRLLRTNTRILLLVLIWIFVAPVDGHADTSSKIPVDVALVLAVDASGSLSPHEYRLQRDGYITALTHPAFLHAIKSGRHGKIAVAYLKWASRGAQKIVVPMTLISSAEDAENLAAKVALARHSRLGHTAIGAALESAGALLATSPYKADREVIDLSANGKSNRGPAPHMWRDRLVAAGITINGLPIVSDMPFGEAAKLEYYFANCVIGGRGAFYLPVTDHNSFVSTLLAKMIHEVAGRVPEMPARLYSASMGPECWQSDVDD